MLRPVHHLVPLPLFQLQPSQVCFHRINFPTVFRTNRVKIHQSYLPGIQRQQVYRLHVSYPASRVPFLVPSPLTSLLFCQYGPLLNHLQILPFQSDLPFHHLMHEVFLYCLLLPRWVRLPCLCSRHFHHLTPHLYPCNLHFLPLMNQASLICLLHCPLLSQLFPHNHQIPHLI